MPTSTGSTTTATTTARVIVVAAALTLHVVPTTVGAVMRTRMLWLPVSPMTTDMATLLLLVSLLVLLLRRLQQMRHPYPWLMTRVAGRGMPLPQVPSGLLLLLLLLQQLCRLLRPLRRLRSKCRPSWRNLAAKVAPDVA